jgi:hypothetical protein
VVVSSASAKTALAMAHRLHGLGGTRLTALTSPANLPYVRSTGLYDQVLAYEEADGLRAECPIAFVDFLGRESLTTRVHEALGSALARSILIGATDWMAKPGGILPPQGPVSGVQPEFFFVPSYAASRIGQDPGLRAAVLDDLRAFLRASPAFVTPNRVFGVAEIERGWRRLCDGAVSPREGLVVHP